MCTDTVLHVVTRRPAVMGIGLCTQKVGADANILLPQPLPHYLLPSVKQARGNGQLYDEPRQGLLLKNRIIRIPHRHTHRPRELNVGATVPPGNPRT